MTTTEPLPVLFRMIRGELLALFPTEKWNRQGDITCYAHVGQHGAASPFMTSAGRRAKPVEYADLLAELRRIYETNDADHAPLKVYQRAVGKASLRRR